MFEYSEDDLVRVIRGVILKNLGLENVEISDHFLNDLKMDEPTKLEVLLAIEHAIGVQIEEERLNNINSVQNVIDLYSELYRAYKKKLDAAIKFVPFAK